MAKRDPKGDVRTVQRGRRNTTASDAHSVGDRNDLPDNVEAESASVHGSQIHTTLRDLLLRDDGWLRISPDGEGKVVYWKWKFTRGPHAGCYVMCVFAPYETWQAIMEVQHKIDRSYLGLHRPTKDSYYDS